MNGVWTPFNTNEVDRFSHGSSLSRLEVIAEL